LHNALEATRQFLVDVKRRPFVQGVGLEDYECSKLAKILAAFEELVPKGSGGGRDSSEFGEEDNAGIDGTLNVERPEDAFRAAAAALNQGLDIGYARSTDLFTLGRMTSKALERRQTPKAMQIARSGPRLAPQPLNKDKISALYPQRDATRDAADETRIPEAPEDLWNMEGYAEPEKAVFEKYMASKSIGTARGLNGPTWDLLKDVGDDANGYNVLFEVVKLLAPETLQRKFTKGEKQLLLRGRGIEIPKADGGIRPIGILNTLASLAHAVMLRAISKEVAEVCTPNMGYGVPGATDALPRLVELVLLNPDWIVVALDVENAFNSLEHDVLLKAVLAMVGEAKEENKPALRVLARHAFNMYASGVPFAVRFDCPVVAGVFLRV